MLKKVLFAAALLPLVTGCSDSTGSDDGRVMLRFATRTGASASVSPAGGASFDHTGTDALTLTGSNGTLRIQDIRLIVSEFELEQQEGSCTGTEDGDDDCEEFEAGPFLVDLPLSGGAVTLGSDEVPAGTYTELEFEVEDLDADSDDDSAERQAIQNIFTQIRQAYPAFPSGASMVVHGTFTPSGSSTAQPFTVYFDAEIEVELDLVPPITIPGTQTLTVNVDPANWFRSGTQVINLAQWNGQTRGFEAEIEQGFEDVEDDD